MSEATSSKSWWEDAPREGFTAMATQKAPELSKSKEARLVVPVVIAHLAVHRRGW